MGGVHKSRNARGLIAFLFVVAVGLLVALATQQAKGDDSPDRTAVYVVVKDAKTGDPIANARLTLQFHEPGGVARLKRPKMISYSAKTNPQGRYKFTRIPKGTIRLLVTADHHQTFGQEFEVEKDNQVIEVKLRKPQPLL
jgi:hypothetical protein